jgi:tripartite-type tricarboxylate transporter receptor subunit TctC
MSRCARTCPYNPAVDFVPLAGIAKVPFILKVNPSLPASVPDLVKHAKDRPGLQSIPASRRVRDR